MSVSLSLCGFVLQLTTEEKSIVSLKIRLVGKVTPFLTVFLVGLQQKQIQQKKSFFVSH